MAKSIRISEERECPTVLLIQGESSYELGGLLKGIDLTFTSPPYYNAKKYADYPSYENYLGVMGFIFNEVHSITKEGGFLIVNSSPVIEPRASRNSKSKRYAIPFDLHHVLTKDNKWEFIDDIIWVKPEGSAVNRNASFFQHRTPLGYKPNCITEYVMVYRKATDKLIDWNIRKHSPSIREKSKVADGYERTNVWQMPTAAHKRHPAVFPEQLAERVISYYSFAGDVVLDPFAGTGTTGYVANKLGRNCIMIESNEDYYDIMAKRMGTIQQWLT